MCVVGYRKKETELFFDVEDDEGLIDEWPR